MVASLNARVARKKAEDLAAAGLGPAPEPLPTLPSKLSLTLAKPAIEERLNKAERRFLWHLRTLYPAENLGIQAFTLRLGEDCRYTPDFSLMPDENGGFTMWDVKALWKGKTSPHVEDDALVKITTAARIYRAIRFLLVWEADNGTWQTRHISG